MKSSNPDVLKGVKRFTIDNDEQYKLIKNLVEQGIVVKSMFMFGQPDDNEETIKGQLIILYHSQINLFNIVFLHTIPWNTDI